MRLNSAWLRVCVLTLAGWLGALQLVDAADDYPSRPIKLYVGFAAGGTTDLVARIVAEKLSERLGQQVVVENRAGGGVATGLVTKSPPDGYSLVMVSASHAINVSLQKNLPYDAIAVCAWICRATPTEN